MAQSSMNVVLPSLPKEVEGLAQIALNLWWTFNPRGKNLFKLLDPYLWKASFHNPIKMLKNLDDNFWKERLADREFIAEYHHVYSLFRAYMEQQSCIAYEEPLPIAYFCAEYGLHHSLPIYSGGLGFLAGDILKESSDMGIPMVGVGFMYPQGYVRQIMGSDGWQKGANETIIKDEAPIERVLDSQGKHLIIQVPFIEPPVFVAVWKVNVGRVSLYLLDTDIEQNEPWDRQISSHLYTPDLGQRLRQEIVLGIGGYRVLEELGIKYSILHLNEGHPAFALFERIRNFMENGGKTLQEAIALVKKSSIFTTHTPLQAATDVYSFDMMSSYFSDYWQRLGMSKEEFLGFGINPDEPGSGFNMTVFALKMCNWRNAVSQKHQQTTKRIWKNLFGGVKQEQIPIEAITNGVHLSTWLDDELFVEFDRVLGEEWPSLQSDPAFWEKIEGLEDEVLWRIHTKNKIEMINFIKEKVRKRWSEEGIDPLVGMAEGLMLDHDVLTIGFARRMTAYKRPDLILYDLKRLERIVTNPQRPVQIIFAGKAHPADIPGKQILQRIFKACQDRRFAGRLAFVEDYGEEAARYLVRGCDLWLNNPKIPLEACGTSGMKASINATLHVSVPDGWWPEGYNGKNGFLFGSEPSDDAKDAQQLYELLEQHIIPLYYEREDDIPLGWTAMMKEAIKSIAPRFSARRMMQEYLQKFYIPITKALQ